MSDEELTLDEVITYLTHRCAVTPKRAVRVWKRQLVQLLRLLVALQEALTEQWVWNHSEHCTHEWPHPEGKRCMWPLPVELGGNPSDYRTYDSQAQT